MTAFDRFPRFERNLPALFDELAAARIPDYTDDLLARTAATRQRPGWAFTERWLPVTSFVARFPAAPRIPWRLAATVALLALATLLAAIVAGTLLQPPSNIGPGRNGEIVLVDKAGHVLAVDPATGGSRVLIAAGGSANTKPIMSPDGTKFLLLRPSAAGAQDVFVVDLEGHETLITPDALTAYHYIGWSPTGDRILIRDDGGRLLILDATKPAAPFVLSNSIPLKNLWIGAGNNWRSTAAWRPPTGNEIMFAAEGGTLAAIRPDGSGFRVILDARALGLGDEVEGAQWSPDGSRIVLTIHTAPPDGPWHTYVVNADGSNPRLLSDLGEQYGPFWSPDGKRVAVEYWTPTGTPDEYTAHPILIVEADTGLQTEVGEAYKDGFLGWEWSPDGASILEVPKDGFGKVLVVDARTGQIRETPWEVDQPISWQRLALDE